MNVRLFTLRKSHKIRQDILSKELGFGMNYIADVETERRDGSIKFWKAVQNRFNIPDSEMWKLILGKE